MSLPAASDLTTLDNGWAGQPWCVIAAHNGTPFYGFNPTGAGQTGVAPVATTTTLRTSKQLSALDYSWNAMPWCVIATKSLDTTTLDYGWQAQPIYAVAPIATHNAALMLAMF